MSWSPRTVPSQHEFGRLSAVFILGSKQDQVVDLRKESSDNPGEVLIAKVRTADQRISAYTPLDVSETPERPDVPEAAVRICQFVGVAVHFD